MCLCVVVFLIPLVGISVVFKNSFHQNHFCGCWILWGYQSLDIYSSVNNTYSIAGDQQMEVRSFDILDVWYSKPLIAPQSKEPAHISPQYSQTSHMTGFKFILSWAFTHDSHTLADSLTTIRRCLQSYTANPTRRKSGWSPQRGGSGRGGYRGKQRSRGRVISHCCVKMSDCYGA